MSLYTITVLTIEFTVFSQLEALFKHEIMLDASESCLFLHDSELLCCNMSGKDCVFVLILDPSDKKHVFLFPYSVFKAAKNRKKKKPTKPTEQSFLLSPNFSSRWGKGRPQESLHALFPWLLVLLPSSPPSVNADLSEYCSVSFEGWLCHETSSFGGCCPHGGSWVENVEWRVWGIHSLPY